jgi:hypothetical protein
MCTIECIVLITIGSHFCHTSNQVGGVKRCFLSLVRPTDTFQYPQLIRHILLVNQMGRRFDHV